MSTENYVLGYRQEETARLQRQAQELGREAVELMQAMGVGPGDRVLEVGCGPQGCLDLLSAAVGASGSVVGIDVSADTVALATAFARSLGLANVTVSCRDARSSGLPPGSFDHVIARLVLVNVPEPSSILAEAVSLARPGGMVGFHEVDFHGVMTDPVSEAFDTMVEMILAVNDKNGNDYFLGHKLPNMLRRAGLENIKVRPILHEHPIDDPRRGLINVFADNYRAKVIDYGFMTEGEYDSMKTALAAHIADPATVVYLGPYIQAWGRKPD